MSLESFKPRARVTEADKERLTRGYKDLPLIQVCGLVA